MHTCVRVVAADQVGAGQGFPDVAIGVNGVAIRLALLDLQLLHLLELAILPAPRVYRV